MMTPPAFITSTIQLPANALKSIIFSSSAFLVQLAVWNLFSLIAFRYDAFTSYLIFSEPLPQQLIYILRRRSFLVLSFLVLFTAGGLWATMLWGLDHPGFVLHTHPVTADTLLTHRRPGPPYAILSYSSTGNVTALNILADLSSGLFAGINATLAGQVTPGQPQLAQTPKWKPKDPNDDSFSAGSVFPTPRIYLDNDGWSVGMDILIQTAPSGVCQTSFDSAADTNWACQIDYTNNTRVGTDFLTAGFAQPDVWWSADSGLLDYENLSPARGINPWSTLGTGGDTVLMKMVFSLARGNRKHTFMVSAMKTTMLALGNAAIPMGDVRDLVRRTWRAGDSAAVQTQDVDAIEAAVGKGMGLTLGRQHTDGYKVSGRDYQVVSVINGGETTFTAFQILDANMTLLNSETVQQAPTPFEDCDTWYQNNAYAGVVTGTTCFTAARADGRTSVFQGQTDTMAVFILSGTLGKQRATTSADALNEDAWRWTQDNNKAIEDLVLSRAYILAGNATSVKVDVQFLRPAVSRLQLMLVLLPVFVFLMSWAVVWRWVESHFQASLFSNLVATTHEGYDADKPDLMQDPPNVGIVRVDGKVYVGTETGVFCHVPMEVVLGGEAEMREQRWN